MIFRIEILNKTQNTKNKCLNTSVNYVKPQYPQNTRFNKGNLGYLAIENIYSTCLYLIFLLMMEAWCKPFLLNNIIFQLSEVIIKKERRILQFPLK